MPTLADTSVLENTVVGINGDTLSREAAVWELYLETQVSGKPFAFKCPRDGQYYLVEFTDQTLEYAKRAYVKLYSTGLEITQVRMDGETIFDASSNFTSSLDLGVVEQITGDVTTVTQNGLNVRRLNATGTTGLLHGDYGGIVSFESTIYDFFIVMKVRESTFGNASGILTGESGGTGNRLLTGASGTALFTNLAHSDYEYRLNGTLLAQSAQAAPINAWGIVHLRFLSGKSIGSTGWQIGKDRTSGSTHAKIDVAEYRFNNRTNPASPLPMSLCRQFTEHLALKWGISI